jgi:protein ImuB
VALASVIEVALVAARGRTGITVIPRGGEEAALGPVSLATVAATLFGPDPEVAGMLVTLESWGVATCAELVALPPLGVLERLGAKGMRLQQMARGMPGRPLLPSAPPPEYRERAVLEYPVALLEPLLFLVADHMNRMCARLDAQSLATNHVELSLTLEDRSTHARVYRLPVPMRDARAFLKLIHLDLESHPPAAPVVAVETSLIPVKPRVLQNGLFVPRAPEPEKLELTLKRIANLVGGQHVGSPRLVDTHRPDAFTLARLEAWDPHAAPPAAASSLVMRRFRPPQAAQVDVRGGRPVRVISRGVRGAVAERAGPWRIAGDWWTQSPWEREEWDVALDSGALYRIFRDERAGGWFLEGEYD